MLYTHNGLIQITKEIAHIRGGVHRTVAARRQLTLTYTTYYEFILCI